jgi:hypothetical protein
LLCLHVFTGGVVSVFVDEVNGPDLLASQGAAARAHPTAVAITRPGIDGVAIVWRANGPHQETLIALLLVDGATYINVAIDFDPMIASIPDVAARALALDIAANLHLA